MILDELRETWWLTQLSGMLSDSIADKGEARRIRT
jgi:hypothetical protein